MSNGEQTEEVNDDTVCHGIAELPSRSFSNHSEVYISNQNKVINTSTVNKEGVIQNNIIHEEYVFARENGISKRCSSRSLMKSKIKITSAI